MRRTGIALLDNRETKTSLLNKLAGAGLPLNIVDRLIKIEQEHVGKKSRYGMLRQMDDILADAVTESVSDDTTESTGQANGHVHQVHTVA